MSSSENEQKLLELMKDLEQFSRQIRFPSGLNIFEAAGMHRQEIRHSNFLAFLLRPQETHGLGAEFLRRLVLKAIDESSLDPPPVKPISVRYACKSDRIDASQRTSALCNKPTHAAQQTARMGSGYSIACR
jgi:hypothetical protein